MYQLSWQILLLKVHLTFKGFGFDHSQSQKLITFSDGPNVFGGTVIIKTLGSREGTLGQSRANRDWCQLWKDCMMVFNRKSVTVS